MSTGTFQNEIYALILLVNNRYYRPVRYGLFGPYDVGKWDRSRPFGGVGLWLTHGYRERGAFGPRRTAGRCAERARYVVVWQALGADPRLISAHSAAQRLDQEGRPPHLVWNPLSGGITQLIPAVRAACLLGAPESLDCGSKGAAQQPAAANRQGRLCVQIAVVASAREPFTDRPMTGRAHFGLAAGLGRTLAVAGRAAGARRPGPRHGAPPGAVGLGGHFGASQIPDWDAAGPGHIDINVLGRSGPPFRQGLARRRKTRPGMVNRSHRTALESKLGWEIETGAAVASLADAPY